MIVFLDIDGVLNTPRTLNGQEKLDRSLVANLNALVERSDTPVEIVFNTAWNRHPLDDMRGFLWLAGFVHPKTLVAQTGSTRGGWLPVFEWLNDQGRYGEPYLIIDDSGHYPAHTWGRLVHTNIQTGFNAQELERALEILRALPLDPETERERCFFHLEREEERIRLHTPWLSEEGRDHYLNIVLDNKDLVRLSEDFLRDAHMEVKNGSGC